MLSGDTGTRTPARTDFFFRNGVALNPPHTNNIEMRGVKGGHGKRERRTDFFFANTGMPNLCRKDLQGDAADENDKKGSESMKTR